MVALSNALVHERAELVGEMVASERLLLSLSTDGEASTWVRGIKLSSETLPTLTDIGGSGKVQATGKGS